MTLTATYTGRREDLVDRLRGLPGMLAGNTPDPDGTVRGLLLALGLQALSLIKTAFIVKSRGGTDEAGIRWKPLDPRYVAYGRGHPGRPRGGPRPTLNADQDRQWRAVYAGVSRSLVNKGMDAKEAGGRAAAAAWIHAKANGATTLLEMYGNAPVEILRDTGLLLNTLSPGSGSADQILRPEPGKVTVGSDLKKAGRLHKDRPLWPDGDLPASWWQRLSDTLGDGIGLVIGGLLRRG